MKKIIIFYISDHNKNPFKALYISLADVIINLQRKNIKKIIIFYISDHNKNPFKAELLGTLAFPPLNSWGGLKKLEYFVIYVRYV